MTTALHDYFEALERLKKNRPINVSKGTKISNDAVALEAGRNKGSIKNSRPVFSDLITAIKEAKDEQSKQHNLLKVKLNRKNAQYSKLRQLHEESLGRELSLLYEIHELKQELYKRSSSKVISLSS